MIPEQYDFDVEEDGPYTWLLLRWREFKAGDGPSPWRRIARFDEQRDAELVLVRLRAAGC